MTIAEPDIFSAAQQPEATDAHHQPSATAELSTGPEAAPAEAVAERPRKLKRRKQEFSLSSQDLALIDVLIARARSADHRARKSEVARAGLALLAELNTSKLVRALQALPPVRSRRK
ncbi:MAG TPA: hypothetical protein PKA20_25815 [Burkholderiaceae bacterium]|nr:hypothetical protein [Burkholderiaceae bacterium]